MAGRQCGRTADKELLNRTPLLLCADEKFILAKQGRVWAMSNVRQLFCSKLECNLFNQIAMFSVTGLSISLALVLTYNLQIGTQWL
jgi:hypothetical protein